MRMKIFREITQEENIVRAFAAQTVFHLLWPFNDRKRHLQE